MIASPCNQLSESNRLPSLSLQIDFICFGELFIVWDRAWTYGDRRISHSSSRRKIPLMSDIDSLFSWLFV